MKWRKMQYALAAYGTVALKRFEDEVPMFCGDVLQHFLFEARKALSLINDRELEELMVFPAEEVEKEKALKRRLEDLDGGLKILEELF